MNLREGSRCLLFLLGSLVVSIYVLGCAQSETEREDHSYRTSSGSSLNPDNDQDSGTKQKLQQIRSAKSDIKQNLPISEILWAGKLSLDSKIVNAWMGPQHIYLETGDQDLWAVSRRTGNPVWTFSIKGSLKFEPTLVKGIPERAVELERQIRQVEEELSSLRAQINPDQEKVSQLTSDLSGLRGQRRELRENDHMYLVVGTTMYVVDRELGTQVDRITLEFAPSAKPYANTNRVLVPGYARNFVYFFNSENMNEIPGERVRLEHPIEAPINQVEDIYLLPTTGGTLYGYSTDGSWVWRAKTDGELQSSPKVKGDSVYLSSQGMQVYSLSRFSGNENWTKHLETPISTAPWIGNSNLYVRDDSNRFYSFGLESGDLNWKKSKGPRSFLFQNKEQVYTKNSSMKKIFVLSKKNGEILNSGSYKPFSFVFRNRSEPVFFLVGENGLMVSARALKVAVEFTTENIERKE